MRLELVTAPTTEPVTTSEAKAYLRVETTADDTLIGTLITVAREAAEAAMGRALILQTWKFWLDAWPSTSRGDWWDGVREGPETMLIARDVALPWGQVSSVTHVKTYAADDTPATMSSTLYYVDGPGARLILRDSATWPTVGRRANGIEIQYVAGWANAAAVPTAIKHGLLIHLVPLYESRGAGALPAASSALYAPYVVYRR